MSLIAKHCSFLLSGVAAALYWSREEFEALACIVVVDELQLPCVGGALPWGVFHVGQYWRMNSL